MIRFTECPKNQAMTRHGGRFLHPVVDFLALAILLAPLLVRPAVAVTEHYVVDPYTGIAIGGYDPVAYFTDRRARKGRPELAVQWQGAIWLFANEGNLAAFRDAPRIYAPQYGGHGAMAVARGFAARGKPTLWRLRKQRLFLFFSPANRHAWDLQPDSEIIAADRNWPRLEKTLAR